MKKVLSIVLAVVLAATSLVSLAGCGKTDKEETKTITVGASVTPHAEILNAAKEVLKKKGYELKVVEYNDYVLPNTATESGELDANYFQHKPYLDNFNEENKTHLVSVEAIHYEPFGIYAGKTKTLADVKNGAKIAIPNDGTNEARALYLLEAQGLIKLKSGIGFTATKLDIESNPKNLEIEEIEAAQLVRALNDVDLAVINGNYAIQGNLKVKDALAVEDAKSESAQTYANILVVKEGNENKPEIKALAEALTSQEVKDFINQKYDGAVVPIF